MNYKEIKELNDSIQSGISQFVRDSRLAYEINKSLEVPRQIPMRDYVMSNIHEFPSEDITEKRINSGWGEDRLDKNILFPGELDNIEENRAQRQKAISQFANGIFKGVITAGTTFADGIAGTVLGALNIGYEALKGNIDSWDDAGAAFIDNPFSSYMHDVQEWSEKAFPSHYTEYEKNAPWYKNIFTANFIGDKFLKNAGFMIGAAYSGKFAVGLGAKAVHLKKARDAFKGVVTTASGKSLKSADEIYKAYLTGDAFMDGVKLTEDLGKAAKKLTNSEWGLKLFGATNAAMGEGRIEAISNIEPLREELEKKNEEYFNIGISSIKASLFKEHPEWFSLTQTDTGMNMQITDPEGIKEFNKRFSLLQKQYEDRQVEIEKLSANALNHIFLANLPLLTAGDLFQFGKFLTGGYSTNRIASSYIKGSIKEGFSPNKIGNVRDILKVASRPIIEGQEEMTQAGISEGSGIYAIRKFENFYERQIDPDSEEETVSFINSLIEGVKDTYSDPQEWEQFFIGALTSVLGLPSFTRVRNEDGLESRKLRMSGDFWDIQRESRENKQIANTIIDYLNNRIQDKDFLNYYRGIIRHNSYERDLNNAIAESDPFKYKNAELSQFVSDAIMFENAGRIQDLYDTLEEAGVVSEKDVESIRNLTVDKTTGKSIYDGMSDQQVIDKINKNISDYRELLNKYVEVSNNLKSVYGIEMTNPVLQEMTWDLMNINILEHRFKSLYDKVVQGLKESGMQLNENISPASVVLTLSSPEVKAILDEFKKNAKRNTPEINQMLKDIKDLKSIFEARADFINKYQRLSMNPSSFEEQIKQSEDKAVKRKTAKTNKQAKEALASVRSPKEYRKVKSDLLSSGKYTQQAIDKIENELIEEKNEIPVKTRNIRNFADGVVARISNSSIPRKQKSDAIEMINKAAENANSLEEMLSSENPFLTDESLFYNDTNPRSESAEQDTVRFIEAQAALSDAIQKQLQEEKINIESAVLTVKEDKTLFTDKNTKKESINTNPKDESSGGVTAKSASEYLSMTDSVIEEDPFSAPIEEVSSTESEKPDTENTKSKDTDTEEIQETPNNPNITLTYWESALSRYLLPALRIYEYIELGDTEAVREYLNNPEFPDFHNIYNYLKSKGAFDYVDAGNVKIGDIIYLAIDPSYDSNQVLLVKKSEDENHIIGVLNEDSRYEGLTATINKVREDFKKADPNKLFISDYSTKVWRVTEGYPIIGDRKNLNTLTENAVFAVIYNGSWALGKYSGTSRDFDSIPNMSSHNGEVYVAVKTAKESPKYYMRKVFVREFSETDLTIEELQQSTEGQNLLKSLNNIFQSFLIATSQKEVNAAIKNLNSLLYVGGLTVRLGKTGDTLIFSRTILDESGNPIKETLEDGKLANKQEFLKQIDKNNPSAMSEIMNVIYSQGFRFQIDKSLINNNTYNRKLIQAGIFETNLNSMQTEGARVLLDPISITETTKTPEVQTQRVESSSNKNSADNIFGGSEEQYYDDNENTEKSAYMADGGTILGIPVKIFANPVYTSYGRKTPALAGYQYGIKFPNNHIIVVRGINPKMPLDKAIALFKQMFEGPVTKSYTQTKLDKAVEEFKKINALPVYSVTKNKVDYNAVRDGVFKLREVDEEGPVSSFDLDKEIEEIKKMLPNVPVQVIKGLIERGGTKAWGMFSNAGITLSNIAAEGTAYHEAFHVVFSLGLTGAERANLVREAMRESGLTDPVEVEEWLAERFREYVMDQQAKTIGQKIRDFFTKLWNLVRGIREASPMRYSIYKKIVSKRYRNLRITPQAEIVTVLRPEEYTPEMLDILSTAKYDKEGRLLAPNGKPSNLNERQWIHVRTKAFKDWFGDWENDPKNASKVVDENGEPLVVYHGGNNNYNTFDINRAGKKSGDFQMPKGFYFTTSKINSETYGSVTKGYFLNIRNPYIQKQDSERTKVWSDIIGVNREGTDGFILEDVEDSYFIPDISWWAERNPELKGILDNIESEAAKNAEPFKRTDRKKYTETYTKVYNTLYRENYETLYKIYRELSKTLRGNTLFTDNNVNIKSATDNIGTYNSSNPDVRFRKVQEDNLVFLKNGHSEEFIKNATPEMIEAAIQCG